MRDRMNVYFPPAMLKQIADLADRKGAVALGDRRGGRRVLPVAGWRRSA